MRFSGDRKKKSRPQEMSERCLYFSHAALVMVCYNSYIRILRDKKKSAYTLDCLLIVITIFTFLGFISLLDSSVAYCTPTLFSYIRLLFPFLPVFFF